MTLGIIDLLVASVPVIGSIIGIYMKMNNLIVRQDMKIDQLEQEIREMKIHNEKMEDKIFANLEEIKTSVIDIKLHFSSCVNFQTRGGK
jgi:hypothetical protein